MKIIIRSIVAAGLGIATLPAFAQTQQPSENACPPGAADCPSGMKGAQDGSKRPVGCNEGQT